MDKSSASNNTSDQQAHNSIYQKLDSVEKLERRQLKLSFPPSAEKKPVPVPQKPVQQQLPAIPRWIIVARNFPLSVRNVTCF